MNNSKGRPQKYTDKELLKILENYLTKNKGKINFLQLEKTTGIKRHVWSRRLGDKIKELNEPLKLISNINSDENPELNIKQLVERFSDNKNGLIKALSHFEDIYNNLLMQKSRLEKKNKQLNDTIVNQKKEIQNLKDQVKYYEDLVVGSSFPHIRRTNNIKDNLISINEKTMEKAVDLKFREYMDILE